MLGITITDMKNCPWKGQTNVGDIKEAIKLKKLQWARDIRKRKNNRWTRTISDIGR